jgi:Tfp pilus assembly protein PilF
VISTVKDESVFVPKPDLTFSQLFFPIKGILVVYCRETGTFQPLPGADDKRFVQSNPTWSPDGTHVVFARAEAYQLKNVRQRKTALLTPEQCVEFLQGRKTFQFDLYEIPFNGGKGGEARPLEGASHNGMSNYFARYSPDGKWIVFCKAKSFMLLQPDSELYIIPASGGKARRLRCNTPRMNSWHSWSPNGKWLVFSSKANSAYTQLFLAHVDERGQSSPAVLLDRFTAPDRAANIPEFVNAAPGAIRRIREQFLDDHSYVRAAQEFIKHGEYDRARRACQEALEINPRSAEALNNLGVVLLETGSAQQAEAHFVKALEYEPDGKESRLNLASLLRRQGEPEKARVHYQEALRIDPDLFEARLPLGSDLLELGNVEEATEHLAKAVRLRPYDPEANYLLGLAMEKQGDPGQATVHYEQALRHRPRHVGALLGLAAMRASAGNPELRDGEQALELAEKACELTRFQDPLALDVLAAAHAECGRFQEAVLIARRALQTARAAGKHGLADAIRPHLEIYEQHQPLRR